MQVLMRWCILIPDGQTNQPMQPTNRSKLLLKKTNTNKRTKHIPSLLPIMPLQLTNKHGPTGQWCVFRRWKRFVTIYLDSSWHPVALLSVTQHYLLIFCPIFLWFYHILISFDQFPPFSKNWLPTNRPMDGWTHSHSDARTLLKKRLYPSLLKKISDLFSWI